MMELLPATFWSDLLPDSMMENGAITNTVETDHCDLTQNVLFPRCCAPHSISDWNEFEVYWKEQRPVIIKGGLFHLDKVTLQTLSKRFGNLNVMVSAIPYATLFGQKAWSIALREYMELVVDGMSSSNSSLQWCFWFKLTADRIRLSSGCILAVSKAETPLYAFESAVIAQNEELKECFTGRLEHFTSILVLKARCLTSLSSLLKVKSSDKRVFTEYIGDSNITDHSVL